MKQRNNWPMKMGPLDTKLWSGWVRWQHRATPYQRIATPSPWSRTKLKKWFYRLGLMCVAAVLCITMGGGVTAQITPEITSEITPQMLLNQGRSLYESGQLTEALTPIQAAIAQYRTQQDDLGEAVALSNLALVQEQRGALPEAVGAIATSIDRLTTMAAGNPSDGQQSALAQSLNVQARIQLAQGQAEAALQTLEQAIALFEELDHQQGVIRSQIRQAEALQTLGFHQAAIALLDPLYQQLKGPITYEEPTEATAEPPSPQGMSGFLSCPILAIRPNAATEVDTIRHLAQAYYQVGQLDRAEALMCESGELATQL
ncbi:MAG: tetratricopeptide repeat protein, partial [Leptolyngbyaceae bacterium]|nr:tetratricopeptide repeat protein [Leptolyngbyaceae bacterium]